MWTEITQLQLHVPMDVMLQSSTRLRFSDMKVGSMQKVLSNVPVHAPDRAKKTKTRAKNA